MDSTRAARLISENLKSIYGYAFARLYDKDKVDDLTQDIVCEILSSCHRLKSEDAFWGFAWKIAENTFRRFIKCEESTPCDGMALQEISPEDSYIDRLESDDKTYLLRRELSLLSKSHREICIAYYVDEKSCSQIAHEQNVSVETVKYHLFKTRKLLKEGIGMTRQLGEKSYNPGTFRLDFWGDSNKYYEMFDRKLPGSIMLAAYYTPMSAKELSIELGVAMPYLEDELEVLERAGLLTKNGARYQTNVVIITDDYEKEFVRKTSGIYEKVANEVYEKVTELLPAVKKLDFFGNGFDDNRLRFMLLNIALVNGYNRAESISPLGEMPRLPLGCNGWIFGYDNDFINHHFKGVTMCTWNKSGTAWFSAENYIAIRRCQIYNHSNFAERAEAMCDAILNNPIDVDNQTVPELIAEGIISAEGGKLMANFPVFSSEVYEEKLLQMLESVTDTVAECMVDISDKAQEMLLNHAPTSVKHQCSDVAKIHHRLDVTAFLMENLIDRRLLELPQEKTPLCIWGVKA